MQSIVVGRDSIGSELQARLIDFESRVSNYVTLQNQFLSAAQEGQRLLKKAEELEGQAQRTDVAWQEMATATNLDQAKINAEIERAEKLRKDAQNLRSTADLRKAILNRLQAELAILRYELVKVPTTINLSYQQLLLNQLLNKEGVIPLLLELFTVSRALHLRDVQENGARGVQTMHENSWLLLGRKLETLFDGADKNTYAPILAQMPAKVEGEKTVGSLRELKELRAAAKL